MGKEEVWSSSVRSREGWRALEEAEDGWTERRASVRLVTSTVLVFDFLSKRSRALALATLLLEAVLILLFSRCMLLRERRFSSPLAKAFFSASPATWLAVLAVSTSDSGEMESVRAGKPEEPWAVTPVLLLFLSSLFSSLSLASRNAITASVSLRRVAVSMLPAESLRSRPLPLLLMRGMSSAGTLPLGFSMVKLPCLTRGFPAFSPPSPAPPFVSSDLFLRSVLPDILNGDLEGDEAELWFRLLVISLWELGIRHSSSALVSFSWGSVSCFSPISDLCPTTLALVLARMSSAGSWGRVLRLRSVRLEEESPLVRDAPDSNASPQKEQTHYSQSHIKKSSWLFSFSKWILWEFTCLFVQEVGCFCTWALRICPGVIGSYTGPLRDPAGVTRKSLFEAEEMEAYMAQRWEKSNKKVL